MVLAGACSSSSKPVFTPTTGRSSGGGATSTTAPVSGTTTRTTTSGSTQAVSRCSTADLAITLATPNGAAGHSFQPIVFTNSSSTPCELKGYPGVSFVAANGDQIGAAADRRPGTPPEVTLNPSDHATATLVIVSPGIQQGCDPPHQARVSNLHIYPPNSTAPVDIPWAIDECSSPTVHQITITAVGVAV
jgi:hypothetical protein